MVVVLCVMALLLLLADTYIVLSVLGSVSWLLKGWLYLPVAVFVGLILWMAFTGDTRQMLLNGIMWITLCIVLPTLVFTVLSLVGRGLGLLWYAFSPIFTWGGLGICLIWIVVALYGSVFGWRRLVVNTVDIPVAGLPEGFEGYRIAQLSDFHIGVYGAAPYMVDKIVERVNALQPDLIVFTGDLVNTSPDELDRFTDALSRLHARDGVISILGNHDYCVYRRYTDGDSPVQALARVVKAEEEMGWRPLRNQSVQITRGNDSIAIVGVENAGGGAFTNKSDLPKALQGVAHNECTILLSHDPSHWRREVLPDTDIPLMLAGHTHAMQFRIGKFSPSKWRYPEWGGLYHEGVQRLYVSTGVGGNIAFRVGAYPSIDLLILSR